VMKDWSNYINLDIYHIFKINSVPLKPKKYNFNNNY